MCMLKSTDMLEGIGSILFLPAISRRNRVQPIEGGGINQQHTTAGI